MTIIFMSIFLFSFATAWEFDNAISNYDEQTEIITFKNGCLFDISWTCVGDVIGEVQLKTPKDFHVARGYNYIWEMDAWVTDDYNNFLKGFEFEYIKNGRAKVNRDIDIKIFKGFVNISVDTYGCLEKTTLGNGTVSCIDYGINGSMLEEKETWEKVTPADIKKADGKVRLRGYTDVQAGDKIDWSPLIFGVRVDHDIWAAWTEDMNTGLLIYQGYNENLINNGIAAETSTVTGTIVYETGKFNKDYAPDTSNYYKIADNAYTDFGTGDYTVTFWVKHSTGHNRKMFWGTGFNIYYNSVGGHITVSDGSGIIIEYQGEELFDNTWHHVAVKREGTNVTAFMDGTLRETASSSQSIAMGDIAIGTYTGGSEPVDGLDELAIWNRSLTDAEITILQTEVWTDDFNSAPSVNLTSPVDNYNSTIPTINFITIVTDDRKVDNVTLYIDGVLNETNSSGFNGTYTFAKTVSLGSHNWSILAYDNESESNQSATRTFNYTDENPLVVLISPDDAADLTSAIVILQSIVTDNIEISNVTLYLDGVANETNSSGYNGTYIYTKVVSEGVHNWSILAYDNQNLSNQSATRTFNYTQPPIYIDLLSPLDASKSQIPLVNVSCMAYNDDGVTQLNLTINGIVNKTVTNSTVGENLTLEQVTNFAEGNYTWGCSAVNPTIFSVSSNRTFEVLYSSPVVVLLLPVNDTSSEITSINFTFNATDINSIKNVSLFIDGVLNETNSSGIDGDYIFYKDFSEGNYTWGIVAYSTLDKKTTSVNRTFEMLYTSPIVTLITPANDSTFLDSNVTFTFTATDDNGIKNVTLFLDGVANKTNSSGVNGSYTFEDDFSDGSHNWTVRAASIVEKITNSILRIFSIHTVAPTVTITEPSGSSGYFLLGANETLTYNISEAGENSSHFDSCWYIYGDDNFCYQESTNISNQTGIDGDCNLDYSGTYSSSGVFTDWDNSIDGNWSTFGLASSVSDWRYSYVNYTKPLGATNESKWVVKSLVTEGLGVNISISQTCWDYNSTALLLRSKSNRFQDEAVEFRNVYWQCYDGSWNTLKEYVNIQYDPIHLPYNGVLYEEAINWNIVNIINCSETEVNFTYVDGVNSITVFAEDTYGLTGSSTSTWEYALLEMNQTYNAATVETSEEDYEMIVKYDDSDWISILAWINYNGTSSQALFTGAGDIGIVTDTLFVGSVDDTTIITFNWTVQLTNATGSYNYTSSNQNQTISKVNFSICNYSSLPQLFFQTYPIDSPTTALNATFASAWTIKNAVGGTVELSRSYEDSTEVNSSWGFCIQPNSTTYTVSVDITVDATNYTPTSHYIIDTDYTAATQNISLYLLADNDSTLTQLQVTDGNYNPIEGAYIMVERYDVGTDTYYTVAMAKTDSLGEDLVYLKWYEDWYRFSIIIDGVVKLVDGPRKISATPVSFKIDDTYTSDYVKFRNILYGLTYNNATENFVLSYITVDGGVSSACLRTIKRNVTADYLICDTCETSTSATIYCNIGAYGNGTFIGVFYATGSPPYYIDWLYEYVNVNALIYDEIGNDNGTGLAILMAGVVLSLFLITPALGVFGMILGMILTFALGLQPFETISFLGIVIVGGMIMWAVQK